jgi:hypothetical protein
MNKFRRSRLRDAIFYMNRSLDIIEDIKDGEESAYDNTPENLQESSRGYDMENNIEYLEDTIDYLNDAISSAEWVI